MNRTRHLTIFGLLVLLVLATLLSEIAPTKAPAPISAAQAATTNAAPGVNVMLIPLQFAGNYTTTTAALATFAMPQPCRMLGVGASARLVGTTGGKIDVKSGGTTILSTPISLTSAAPATYVEGTLATTAITDENSIVVDFNAPGGATSLNDITVLMTCARR